MQPHVHAMCAGSVQKDPGISVPGAWLPQCVGKLLEQSEFFALQPMKVRLMVCFIHLVTCIDLACITRSSTKVIQYAYGPMVCTSRQYRCCGAGPTVADETLQTLTV